MEKHSTFDFATDRSPVFAVPGFFFFLVCLFSPRPVGHGQGRSLGFLSPSKSSFFFFLFLFAERCSSARRHWRAKERSRNFERLFFFFCFLFRRQDVTNGGSSGGRGSCINSLSFPSKEGRPGRRTGAWAQALLHLVLFFFPFFSFLSLRCHKIGDVQLTLDGQAQPPFFFLLLPFFFLPFRTGSADRRLGGRRMNRLRT